VNLIPLLLLAAASSCLAFAPMRSTTKNVVDLTLPFSSSKSNHDVVNGNRPSSSSSLSTLLMAGFGGGGSSSKGGKKTKKNKNKKNKSAPITLKPKQQWDRFANLKSATAFKVAVRVLNDDNEDNEWYEAGKVKSQNDESTEIAAMVQRGIIAEHSKRLYPLKILPKDRVEWAYSTSSTPEQGDWILLNKDVAKDAPAGIEKNVGFEGKPDAATGFYCHYENGRMIDRYSGDVVKKE
jgi:hypothetical protein